MREDVEEGDDKMGVLTCGMQMKYLGQRLEAW